MSVFRFNSYPSTLSTHFTTTTLRLCLLASLGLLTPMLSQAAEPNTDAKLSANDEPTTTLDPIIVTASRSPTRQSNVIAQTKVIDAEDLKRYQGKTVLDVIKNQPGFSYYQNGGMGTSANFYVRGYDSKQVLVLIDGIRYGAVNAGQVNLNLLPVNQVERIEILYGASGSSIYGSDAMGGVIQIFTKNGQNTNSLINTTVGVGSHQLYQYGASFQHHTDTGTTLSLGASHTQTDGFNATLADNPYGNDPDKDGFDSKNYSLALNQDINEQLSVGLTGLYSRSISDFDAKDYQTNQNIKPAYAKQKNGAAQAHINWLYAPNSSLKLQYGQSIDNSTNYGYNSTFDNTQKQLSLVGNHSLNSSNKLGNGRILYGAEQLEQSIKTTAYKEIERKVTSGFLGYLLANKNFDAQANIRYDNNSQYGGQTTYNLGGSYHLTPQLRMGASYAKAFRAPSFNELYYPMFGTPTLKPENSDNYEVFTEYNTLNQSTRLTGYYNDVDNLIASDGKPYPDARAINIDKAKIQGVSLTSDWYLDNYLLGVSYDYQKATDNSNKDNDGNFLSFRPEHKGLVYIGYQLPQANIRAEYQYVGDYYSGIANLDSQKVEHYGLLNLSGNYQLTPQLSMNARLNNLTNKKYVTTPKYSTDGTNFFTSLTYEW